MDTQIHDFIVYGKEMTLQKMLKLDLVLQIMSQIDYDLKEKIKKQLD